MPASPQIAHSLRGLSCAVIALAGAASAQTITVLVRDGDPLPGGSQVTSVYDVDVDDRGTTIVSAETDAPPPGELVVLRDGALLARQGDPLAVPATASIASWTPPRLDDAGRASWVFYFSWPTPNSVESGVYRDFARVRLEDDLAATPPFPGGTRYDAFFGVKNDGANELLVLTRLSSGNMAFVAWTLDAASAVVSERIVMESSTVFPISPPALVTGFTTVADAWDFNRSGQTLYVLDTTAPLTSDGFLMLDSTVLAREGGPSPVSGATWRELADGACALNDAGEYAFRAKLSTGDTVICKNGTTIVARQETSSPAIGGTDTFASFGAVEIDDAGNVYWYATWHDPATFAPRGAGLFRNDQLVVHEGVSQAGGLTVERVLVPFYAYRSFAVSRDGGYAIVACVLTGNVDAAVLLDFGDSSPDATPFCFGGGSLADHTTPCPCGNAGLAGRGCGHSFDPHGARLGATGRTAADDIVLHSEFTPASAFTMMLQQPNAGDTIVHDGVLCASGPLVRLRGRAAVAGEAFFPNSSFANDATTTLSQRGGVTVGSGVVRYYSALFRNAASTFCPPATANVTNGLRITW